MNRPPPARKSARNIERIAQMSEVNDSAANRNDNEAEHLRHLAAKLKDSSAVSSFELRRLSDLKQIGCEKGGTVHFLASIIKSSLIGRKSLVRHEAQHCTVDAVALAGGRRAVVEDMAQMDSGTGADHFHPMHAQAVVFVVDSTRPAQARRNSASPSRWKIWCCSGTAAGR